LQEWRVKLDPLFERNLKAISSRSVKKNLNDRIKRLKENPHAGKQLRPPYDHLWEIKIGKFRLYYEIWEKQHIIMLKAFYSRKLQKRYLRGKITQVF